MEIDALSDSELLADWLEGGREASFHALVRRYAGLVHMAALRTCEQDNSLAAEASQLTFIVLVRKAKSLSGRRSLAGWLHLTAVMQAKNLIRQTRRESRKRRQLLAVMEDQSVCLPDADAWNEMRPVLDEALAALSARDREALLLRFYRSLSVREIGEALGIASDAAQKRLDRATAKLRARLRRCGCGKGGNLAGASLAAVLCAGFVGDSQAALPAIESASTLAAKALSSGAAAVTTGATAAAGGSGISTLLKLILLKNTSLIPPALVLLLSAAWIGSQRLAMASLAKENGTLERRLAAPPPGPSGKASRALPGGRVRMPAFAELLDETTPVNWKRMAALALERRAMGIDQDMTTALLERRLESMSPEDLESAWKAIHSSGLTRTEERDMEMDLLNVVSRLSPGMPLTLLGGQLGLEDNQLSFFLAEAFRKWVDADPAKASAWLDARIASGQFDSGALDGGSRVRDRFVGKWIAASLGNDPEAVTRRLSTLAPEARAGALSFVSFSGSEFSGKVQQPFVDLLRSALPEDQCVRRIAEQAGNLAWAGLPQVAGFLDRVRATPAEREASVGKAAAGWLESLTGNQKIQPDDYDRLRDWVSGQAPGALERVTGAALGEAASGWRALEFGDASARVLQYQKDSGSDEGLVAFLKSEAALARKDESRDLAGHIKDEKLRTEVLRNLETPFLKP